MKAGQGEAESRVQKFRWIVWGGEKEGEGEREQEAEVSAVFFFFYFFFSSFFLLPRVSALRGLIYSSTRK